MTPLIRALLVLGAHLALVMGLVAQYDRYVSLRLLQLPAKVHRDPFGWE
jgi:hypothetical protein